VTEDKIDFSDENTIKKINESVFEFFKRRFPK